MNTKEHLVTNKRNTFLQKPFPKTISIEKSIESLTRSSKDFFGQGQNETTILGERLKKKSFLKKRKKDASIDLKFNGTFQPKNGKKIIVMKIIKGPKKSRGDFKTHNEQNIRIIKVKQKNYQIIEKTNINNLFQA